MKYCSNIKNQYNLCYNDSRNTCDCCIINYMPLVSTCDINIKIITQTENVIIQEPEFKNWWKHLWNYIKCIFDQICLFRIVYNKLAMKGYREY